MKKSADEILHELVAACRDVFGRPALELTMATRQDDVEGWDSLVHIQLVLALGKRFGVTFTTKDVMGWTDVGSIVRCLEGKLA